jgi:hypothetical protein
MDTNFQGEGQKMAFTQGLTYYGIRDAIRGASVKRSDCVYIKERREMARHSDGFEWGYGGSGPAQLAVALLMDTLEDADHYLGARDIWGQKPDEKAEWALSHYQKFKWEVVCELDRKGFSLPQEDVRAWISYQLVQDKKMVCNY